MRPRERYCHEGAEGLGDGDMLALVLGTGVAGRSALQIATTLIERFDGLGGVARAQVAELAKVPGVGPNRAIRVHAALEVGRRSVRGRALDTPIHTPDDAWAHLAPALEGLDREELHALYLDRRRRPVGQRSLTRGSDGYTVVDPRQVFRVAVGIGAAAVVLAHNHPSGDPTPSPQDREVTRRVAAAGRVLGIPLVDHLVVGNGRYCSLAAEGALPPWPEEPVWTAEPRAWL